jgi:two-component system LytT family response regulator
MDEPRTSYVVVDDERLSRERLFDLLSTVPGMARVGEATNGLEAIEVIERTQPDVVFLDVQMPGLDGLAVAESLRMARPPRIVFVTAFDEYALRAFEANAIDYLLKPVTRQRLELTIKRLQPGPDRAGEIRDQLERLENLEKMLRELRTEYPEVVVGRQSGRIVLVEIASVLYFQVEDRLVFANLANARILINSTLKDIEGRLDPKMFCRVHRQMIVNIRKIRQLCQLPDGNARLILSDGREIQTGRHYVNQMKARLLWT